MPQLLDPTLAKALAKEKKRFQTTKIPIITVSGSYKEDIKGFYGYPEDETLPDVVFSRAHYSMALGIAVAAWKTKVDPQKAYVIDPTNFVSADDWKKIVFTQFVGELLARKSVLKRLKDLVDRFGRSKLPILSSIEPPLLQLSENISKPFLSLHIAAGNMLASYHKSVLQVITDPHVREEYLNNAENPHFFYCVFDDATKAEALEKATYLGKKLDPNRVIVTGPPIDPRIVRARKNKHAWRSGPLRLCITTGGLGTNAYEIRTILRELLPLMAEKNENTPELELLVYASTHNDIAKMVTQLAHEFGVPLQSITSRTGSVAKSLDKNPAQGKKSQKSGQKFAPLRLIYHPQIVDANELLIEHGLPWADGFITKPSGDMAYDAAAAGCFLLTLKEWGEWEHNVRERFEALSIARRCEAKEIVQQLREITSTEQKSQSWVEQAMNSALSLDAVYLNGAESIINAYEKMNGIIQEEVEKEASIT